MEELREQLSKAQREREVVGGCVGGVASLCTSCVKEIELLNMSLYPLASAHLTRHRCADASTACS